MERQKADTDAVKAWLKRYGDLDADLEATYVRLDELETRMTSISSPTLTDMPHGERVFDKMGRYMVRKERVQDEIQKLTNDLIDLEAEIEKALKQLPKSEERSVVRLRYIDLKPWADVSFSMFGSQEDFEERSESYLRRVTKDHKRALENLARIFQEENPQDCRTDSLQDNPQECLPKI